MSAFIRAAAILAVAGLVVGPVRVAAATTDNSGVSAQVVAQATPPAQGTGTVTGTVTDNTGAPIAGAKIEANGGTAKTTTDLNGKYSLDLAPGIYSIAATKGGYTGATQEGVAVLQGSSQTLNVTLQAATFSSLREIGRVSVNRGRSAFNAGPISIQTISNATFNDQGTTQVQQVLDQTPGIVIDHPGTSANNASPGAITFPSIRGGLGFETASLIDGHPLAVQTFGDYVTTFLNTDVLQSVEVIKGPGASSPTINYAINGTVNFRTLDPTANLTGQVKLGYDSYGGQQSNFRISDTVLNHKLGFVLDYAIDGTPGPLENAPGYVTLNSGWLINGGAIVGATQTGSKLPGVQNQIPYFSSTVVGCCQTLNETYNSKTELAKLQYHFSPATVATVSYLGSQAYVDQNGAHLYEYGTNFTPGSTYIGSLPSTVQTYQNTFFPNNFEINNEPIFQGEIRTTLGRDTILGRYYAASINRLAYEIAGPNNVASVPLNLSGTLQVCPAGYNTYNSTTKLCSVAGNAAAGTVAPVTNTYNNSPVTATINAANYTQAEEDKLHGGTFEYDHVIGDSDIVSLSVDQVNANTDSYSGNTPASYGYSIFGGEKTRYTSALLRTIFNLGKLNVTLANYYNNYQNTYSTTGTTVTNAAGVSTYIPSLQTATFGRYDGRLGLAFRVDPNTSIRASVGSAVAPPYLALLTTGGTSSIPVLDSTTTFATNTQNNGLLRPETAFGYDLGADFRTSADGLSTLTTDFYLNNVFNQFVSRSEYANGTTTVCNTNKGQPPSTYVGGCPGGVGTVTVPLLTSGSLNLSNARYMGIEVSAKRTPTVGFGYNLSGALIRAYPYNVNPCIYYTTVANGKLTCSGTPNANLAIVTGPNYFTSGTSLSFAVSNHSEPYAQGYASVSYATPRGGYFLFGEQYYGNNNSLNVPAFFRADATVRFPIYDNKTFIQAACSNLFNIYGTQYITPYGGNGVPLVNGNIGLTNANVIGPRFVQFNIVHNFGGR